MNRKNLTIFSLLAVMAIGLGGLGFVLAQDTVEKELQCNGGVLGLLNGRGFWAQLSEEQRTELAEKTQEMLDAGATQEEIREMKATMLQEWGIEAPQWNGPHMSVKSGYGGQTCDGSGGGNRFGGYGNCGQVKGGCRTN